MNSRDIVLSRIRRALADVPRDGGPEETHVPRDYWQRHAVRNDAQRIDLLAGNLSDYRAVVHRCTSTELPVVIGRLLRDRGARRVVAPWAVPDGWLPGDVERVADSAGQSPRDLDAVDSVVTGCAVAVAETGTIVLDAGEDQGRRRISLVPDHHICVVHAPSQVVDSVPQALGRLDPARPQTWISGPSATSDIELDRVEGVHGPRRLDVVISSPGAPRT
ncbi:L-lactate dehydrogenase complex protein LldG [Streptomyces sp. WMMB 714]|uniref:LutC/YkgG family protein n=1 Tax=Streptomyces sp. WMMB 714 TaxID=1286822 RepID=UPI0005F864DB|nr:LUD domain-containing protein [Streptomyces sp. WMMB 714]SCK08616.1 L-lactate dehydrogenase complex protein LldG [Streptomyces sp. WMMB 714]